MTSPDSPPATARRPIEARLVKGFRDYLPVELLERNRMIGRIRAVYERYGFAPLDTPAVEHLDVLTGQYGEEGSKQLFRLLTPEEEPVGLRFDLTVPLARVVAQYPELPRPFRRYQVSPVWRSDKPGPGRFREFLQFDVDIVGASSLAADAEVLGAGEEALRALGLKSALIRVSSRRLLNALLAHAGIPAERGHDVIRVLDKLDKQGLEAVLLELTVGRVDASGDRIPGLGLDREPVGRIERFLRIERQGRGGTLRAVAAVLGDGPGAAEAVAELDELDRLLAATGLSEERVVFDPTLARGLAYYTGPIFEAVLPEAPEFGTVMGGGRYDGLVGRFLGEAIPATGLSIGVDRLLAALKHLGLVESRPSTTDVLVTVLDRSMLVEYQRIAAELRQAGIASEVYLGDQKGLKKQLAYADRIGARLAILLGGDEAARGEVTVKDLVEGARHGGEAQDRGAYLQARFGQRTVPRAELAGIVRGLLSERGI